MTLDAEALFQQFQSAVADLWWMSETDAPFQVHLWTEAFESGVSSAELAALLNLDPTQPTQEVSLDQFFAPAIEPQDWHGVEEKQEQQRFQTLRQLIDQTLSEPRVFRFGQTEVEICILGQTPQRSWLALTTQAVET